METIVALDIETTGLDPEKDAVIEIGAVRFKAHRIEAEWSTLIHPGRRIPPFITQLTGITDQMVLDAPAIREVTADLARFVGNAPILGHNIRFDLAFLRRQGILGTNPSLDTYDMAAVLVPSAGRYNLGALSQALGVIHQFQESRHRGPADAHTTRGVFLRLYELALELPLHVLAEIVHQGDGLEWGAALPFRWALKERSKEIAPRPAGGLGGLGPLFEDGSRSRLNPLQPDDEPQPLDPDEVASILEPGGLFAHHLPQFEYRPEQVEMLRAVTDAFNRGRHLLVEAGTGVGKSMAYLAPAAIWALHNKRRVVISTNTINLQDQLINKDIPDLRHALGLDLRAVVLKGRSNYLCPRRLESLRRHGPENPDDMRVLGKVLVWLQETRTGDRAEINLNGPGERAVWARISADDDGCTGETCLKKTGGACPFYRVRQAALNAHLLIVNHALLLADVAARGNILPDYEYLIVDEAHHLEDATTSSLSYHITQFEIDRIFRTLGGPNTGLLAWVLDAAQNTVAPDVFAGIFHLVQRATDQAFRLENLVREYFFAIEQFLNDQRQGSPAAAYSQQERIVPATRTQPAWMEVESAWFDADQTLRVLIDTLLSLARDLVDVQEMLAEEDEELIGSISNLIRSLSEFRDRVNALTLEPSDSDIYWVELPANGNRASIHVAPLHIGALMQQHIWQEKTSVVLTSATLTAAGEFNYIRGRLGADDAYELALGSPFHYDTAALLYLANDIPEPSDRNGHQRAVETGLIQLCRATGGRALALFTSYDQLKRTAHAIAPVLARDEIVVFEQGEGASPHALLENFRSTERAILLGTRSFWEGVDVPGQALSVVVIVKLPFDVPSDPVIAARSETFERPFDEYQLPEAILRFRQGFGRLIRTQADHGVVAVLDRRLLTKSYGRLFLASLPDCTKMQGKLENLPREARKWLNL